MATRFYLPSTGAAAVTPALGAWDETAGAGTALECVTTKIASAMASVTVAKGTGATRALVRQYVSKPIAAQTISAGTVTGQIRALESAANDNLDLVPIRITVVSNDGATLRGTILALGDYVTVLEFGTVLTNRKIADGDATTSVTALAGDRIVIEIGIKNSTVGVSVSGDLSFGDNSGTDLAVDTTTTTANNPWVELSNTITFQVSVSPKQSVKVIGGQKRKRRRGKATITAAYLLAIPPATRPIKPITVTPPKRRRRHRTGRSTLVHAPRATPAVAAKRRAAITIARPPKRRKRPRTQSVISGARRASTKPPKPQTLVIAKKRRKRQGDTTLVTGARRATPVTAQRPRKTLTSVTAKKRRRRAGKSSITAAYLLATPSTPPAVRPKKSITTVKRLKRRARAGSFVQVAARLSNIPVQRPIKPATIVLTRKRPRRAAPQKTLLRAKKSVTPVTKRPTKPTIVVAKKRRKRSGTTLLRRTQLTRPARKPRSLMLVVPPKRKRRAKGSTQRISTRGRGGVELTRAIRKRLGSAPVAPTRTNSVSLPTSHSGTLVIRPLNSSLRMSILNGSIASVVAGDDLDVIETVTQIPSGQTLAMAWLTFKSNLAAADPGLLQKVITPSATPGEGQITDVGLTGTGSLLFQLSGSDTLLLPVGVNTPYDIKVKTSAGKIYTAEQGQYLATQRVTASTS